MVSGLLREPGVRLDTANATICVGGVNAGRKRCNQMSSPISSSMRPSRSGRFSRTSSFPYPPKRNPLQPEDEGAELNALGLASRNLRNTETIKAQLMD